MAEDDSEGKIKVNGWELLYQGFKSCNKEKSEKLVMHQVVTILLNKEDLTNIEK